MSFPPDQDSPNERDGAVNDLWEYDDEDRAKIAAGWTPVHAPPMLTECWIRPPLSPAVGLRRYDTGDE